MHVLPERQNSSSDWLGQNGKALPVPAKPVAKPVEPAEADMSDDDLINAALHDSGESAAEIAKDNNDGYEDMLSAGLRNTALEKERVINERKARRIAEEALKVKMQKAAATIRALTSTSSIKARRFAAAAAARKRLAEAKALKRASTAVGEINTMMKQVVEEMELEKSRCETYMCAAKREVTDAREISMDDQERMARIEMMLHASEAENSDILGQKSDLAEQLKEHKGRCGQDMAQLRSELGTLKTDANTTTKLMSVSPCKGQALLLECKRVGSRKPYIASRHRGLHQVMAQLHTSTARRSLQRALRRAVRPKQDRDLVLLQRKRHRRLRNGNTHEAHEKRNAARCRAAAMDCKAVETAIVLMMADVQDKQQTTKIALDKTTSECDAVTIDLEEETAHFEQRRQLLEQHVAEAMAEKTGLGGEVALRLGEYKRLTQGLKDVTKECEGSVKAYENQQCTLKQSRTNVFANNGVALKPDDLRDCEVSPWSPAESCSEDCDGGEQTLIRTVVTPAGEKGMPCPALTTKRACNVHSCPVDCKVSEWTGWTECSVMCGGGTRSRTRRISTMAQHGGQICPGENSISEACNTQNCVPDCVLGLWTPWTVCSRACNGGFQRRTRQVSEPARGNGLCPSEDERSEYLKCNKLDCPVPKVGQTLKCNSAVDLIVVLDGSESVDADSFKEAQSFVVSLFKAMNLGVDKGQAAIVLAGGPKAWKDFEKCKLEGSSEGALASCNVALKLSLSAAEGEAVGAANGIKAPGGPAYTAGALSLAASQVDLSRAGATPIVLVVSHGKPLSQSRTSDEAAKLRGKARLMWMVVGGGQDAVSRSRTLSAQLAASWASAPTTDNVFQVNSFKTLSSLATVSDVVSAVCPSVEGIKQ
jgi:hypothetical protein